MGPILAASARSRIDGVLFDYGRTLVTFAYPKEALLEVLARFQPRIDDALGRSAPPPEVILSDVLLPLEDQLDNSSEDEVIYLDVYREAWQRAGLDLPDDLLLEILDAEQLCWDHAVQLDPSAMTVLSWLGSLGVKRGLCSNAPFPPEMMRRQVDTNGIGRLMDVVVFSSQVGRRKPAPEIYAAALAAMSLAPERALFVGDRVREDYEGPLALGMRALICTAHTTEPVPDGIPTIASLADLPGVL